MNAFPGRCGGVVLISVLMVMVVLGLMASYLVENLSGQSAGASLLQVTSQTEMAARSGMEWARDRALRSGSCGPGQLQLGGVIVNVACAAQSVQEGANTYIIYAIDIDARHGAYGDWDHVRRTLSASFASR